MKKLFYQNEKDGTLKGTEYTAEKNKIMKATCENFMADLRADLEKLQYKYLNNTTLYDTEQEYLNFCRNQVNATALKLISDNIKLLG